jgi:hypothetical protein
MAFLLAIMALHVAETTAARERCEPTEIHVLVLYHHPPSRGVFLSRAVSPSVTLFRLHFTLSLAYKCGCGIILVRVARIAF